jgi:hypothetical protein
MPTFRWSSLFDTQTPLSYVATFALLVTLLSHGQAVLVPMALPSCSPLSSPLVIALER